MIEIKIMEDVRNFKKGKTFKFDKFPLVMVGKNGCGKTTLINIMRVALKKTGIWTMVDSKQGLNKVAKVSTIYDETIFLSKEDDPAFAVDVCDAIDLGGLAINNKSSGEKNQHLYVVALRKAIESWKEGKNTLFVLDEMDAHLDMKTQKIYVQNLKDLNKKGIDVVIATHHFGTASLFEEVYDFENEVYVKPLDYFEKI